MPINTTIMKKVWYYLIMTAIALIIAIFGYAYSVDREYGSYEQQQLDLAVIGVFAFIGLLYYFLIPIQKNNETDNH
jgi:uncharacterized membrane protein YdjX (TVP38/TMEM64 family)